MDLHELLSGDKIVFERFFFYCEDFKRNLDRLTDLRSSLTLLIKSSQTSSLKFVSEVLAAQERTMQDTALVCHYIRDSLNNIKDSLRNRLTGRLGCGEGLPLPRTKPLFEADDREESKPKLRVHPHLRVDAHHVRKASDNPPKGSTTGQHTHHTGKFFVRAMRDKSSSMKKKSVSLEKKDRKKQKGQKKRGLASKSAYSVISPKAAARKKEQSTSEDKSQELKKKLQWMADQNLNECLNLKTNSAAIFANASNLQTMKTTRKHFRPEPHARAARKKLEITLDDFTNPILERPNEWMG